MLVTMATPVSSHVKDASARENYPTRERRDAVVRAGAWSEFYALSRFARSTIPEEKWGLLVV